MTERWLYPNGPQVKVPEIDVFIEEIKALCYKHGLSISHEDGHGAFIIEYYKPRNIDWLKDAHDGREYSSEFRSEASNK